MQKIAILGTVVVLLGCSTATVADDHKTSFITEYQAIATPGSVDSIFGVIHTNTMLEQQAELVMQQKIAAAQKQKAMIANESALDSQIKELRKHVGKTWYVFSGSQPSGWDCSGMTRWFYGELGIDIPHSASKQGNTVGWHVEKPKPGDIVAFSHMNSEKYYHVGIYIGNNKLIHAGFRKGTKTEVISLDSPSFKNSEISFVRVIEN